MNRGMVQLDKAVLRSLAELPAASHIRVAAADEGRAVLSVHSYHVYLVVDVCPAGPQSEALIRTMRAGQQFPCEMVDDLLSRDAADGVAKKAPAVWEELCSDWQGLETPEEIIARRTAIWQGLALPDPAGQALGVHPAKVSQLLPFVEAAGLHSAIPSVWIGRRMVGTDEVWSVIWVWPAALAAVACTVWGRVPGELEPWTWLSGRIRSLRKAEEEERA